MEAAEKAGAPHSAMVELTWRCPLRCRHCYLPAAERARREEPAELGTGELRRVFDEMAELGVLYLTLSGGEICRRPDLPELVAHARRNSFDVRLFTSGALVTPPLAAELARRGVARAEISLYGREETHDRITGVPGSYGRSLAGARLLKANGIAVTIKAPLMNLNIPDYPFLVRLAEEEGFLYGFDPTVVPRDDGDKTPTAFRCSDEVLGKVFRDPRLRVSVQGDRPEDHDTPTPLCEAGRSYVALGPNGDVYPCLQWRAVLGNVRRNALKDIWNSEEARRRRAMTRADYAVCNACDLLAYCPRCTGVAEREDGDFLGPSAAACRLARLNRDVLVGRSRSGAERPAAEAHPL